MRFFCLMLYYAFARFFPKSTTPAFGKPSLRLRRTLCRRIFATCGKNLNVEQGAYFGNGKDVRLGHDVGIGKNFKMLNRILVVDDYLMMGEDVLFLGGGHEHSRTDIPMGEQHSDLGKTPLHIAGDVCVNFPFLGQPVIRLII